VKKSIIFGPPLEKCFALLEKTTIARPGWHFQTLMHTTFIMNNW